MKNRIPHNPMNAPLTNEMALFQGTKNPGIEFVKPVRIVICSKCGQLGGTLKNIGTKQEPKYQHLGRCPARLK